MKQMNIWTAVGLLQLIYGLILILIGVRQFGQPPPTVLANLHATFWAGIVWTLVGLILILANRSAGRRGYNKERFHPRNQTEPIAKHVRRNP